jgi:hypothetical protein
VLIVTDNLTTISAPWLNYNHIVAMSPTPLAARSKPLVCGRSFAGIVGSNSAEGMVVCLL